MFKIILSKIGRLIYPSEPIAQDIVGIDVSHGYVRAVQLNKKANLWTLTKLSSKTISSFSDDPERADAEILSCLKNIRLEQKFDTDNAAISLPISSSIVQVIQVPFLEENELKTAVENGSLWDSTITLPGDLSEYSVFWQVVKEDRAKNQMSILFVASRIDEIEKRCDLVRKAGFDPLIVDVRCFALRNILKTYNDSDSLNLSVFLEISAYENYIVFIYDDLPFIYDVFVTDSDNEALKSGGEALTEDLFQRIGSQIRTSVSAFISQSGAPGIEQINVVSSLTNFDVILEGLKKEIVEFKVRATDPVSHINIPLQIRTRVESEKNPSSLTVALGLATRRLDIFGYYKFVQAVANINLLPNRDEIIQKEKQHIESQTKFGKYALISSLIMFMLMGIYAYMMTSFPGEVEIESLQTKIGVLQSEVAKSKADYDSYQHWLKDVAAQNKKMLDLSFLDKVPSGVFVVELSQQRDELSLLVVKSTDQSLVSDMLPKLGASFRNVKLMGVESGSDDFYQTSKISYQVK